MNSRPSIGPTRMSCPACGGRVKIPAGQAGQRFRCPRCDAEITAPAIAEQVSAPAADDDILFDSPPPSTPLPVPTVPPPVPPPSAPLSPPPPPAVPIDAADGRVKKGVEQETQAEKPPSAPAADRAKAPAANEEEFGIVCPLCGTLQYVTPAKIGKAVRCLDCHSTIPVRPPEPRRPPPVPVVRENGEQDDYRLTDVVERPQVAGVHERILKDAERELEKERQSTAGDKGPRRSLKDVFAENARELMGRAQAAADEAEREASRYVIRPLFAGLISFLLDVQAFARWVVLTLAFLLAITFLQQFFTLMHGGPFQQFGAVVVGMLLALVGLFYAATASICWLAILQDTANGLDRIEQWPGLSFLDWVFDCFYIVNCLFVAVLPGVLLGQLPVLAGLGSQWIAVVLGSLTAIVIFPILLLSVLDNGSPLGLWSSDVIRSLRRNRPTVQQFYLASAGLGLAAIVSLGIMNLPWFLVRALGAAGFNAALMIYFRLLGRLAGLLLSDVEDADEAESS